MIVLVFSLAACGCGSSETETGQGAGQPGGDPLAAQTADPVTAVTTFLNAVKRGDDDTAANLLTALARQKTNEMDMAVAPPGSDTASFQVGQVEQVGEGAHVASSWTDVDGQGNPRTDQITWILRQEPVGWRIAGMATKIFADQDPIVLNFENPQEMINQQQAVAAEEARRQSAAENQQARQPEDPFQNRQ
jgi:hypothetical protein